MADVEELRQLAELRDSGIVTEEEFEKEKHKILNSGNLPSRPEELRQLGELRDSGIVTEEEFEKEKHKILNGGNLPSSPSPPTYSSSSIQDQQGGMSDTKEIKERLNWKKKIAIAIAIAVPVLIIISITFFVYDGHQRNNLMEKHFSAISSGNFEEACSMILVGEGQFKGNFQIQSCADCGACTVTGMDLVGCDVYSCIEAATISVTNTGQQAKYTNDIYEYKIELTLEYTNGAKDSWCEIWYGAKNTGERKYGILDGVTSTSGKVFDSGENVSC